MSRQFFLLNNSIIYRFWVWWRTFFIKLIKIWQLEKIICLRKSSCCTGMKTLSNRKVCGNQSTKDAEVIARLGDTKFFNAKKPYVILKFIRGTKSFYFCFFSDMRDHFYIIKYIECSRSSLYPIRSALLVRNENLSHREEYGGWRGRNRGKLYISME